MAARQRCIWHLKKQLRNQGNILANFPDREMDVVAPGAKEIEGQIRKLRHSFHRNGAVILFRAAGARDQSNLFAEYRYVVRISMSEDILRRLSHKPLPLKKNIGHIVRNHGLYRARKISCSKLCVAFRGKLARVIDAEIHPNKRSHGLQRLFDLLLIPASNSTLCVLPQVLE